MPTERIVMKPVDQHRCNTRAAGICVSLLFVITSLGSQAADPTNEPLLRLETGRHTAPIMRIASDAAGRWAVTSSEDKTARVWDLATGQQVQVLRPPQDRGDEGKLYAVAMSPDGAVVAVGGWTGWDWDQQASIYLFDRSSGALQRRIAGLPNVVFHLAYSPDGRWLAASLAEGKGVRVFAASTGAEVGRDKDYGSGSYSVHFSPDSRRLVTTCLDGKLRLYTVDEGRLSTPKIEQTTGGTRPIAARFSPDGGRRIAVGYDDTTTVQVLDANTLREVARPAIGGVNNGDLSKVAWSADGKWLAAGGRWQVDGRYPVRLWQVDHWSDYRDVPLSADTVMDLIPTPAGGFLFAAADPTWGELDAQGKLVRRQDGALADLRDDGDQFRLSRDGRKVRFGYEQWGEAAKMFDVATRRLEADDPTLAPARIQATGLKVENWKNRTAPTLNGKPLTLDQYETSRSLAIAPDGKQFVLGTEWNLRLFDREGAQIWPTPVPVPGIVWAVNISADGRYVVAGYADGTIRWHRLQDGQEVLAFFPHADRKRWVAWTPEGFYDASPDAEGLIGYHLNRGRDREGEFVSASQLREKFYQPGLIARRLDADGDQLIADAVKQLGDVRQLLAGAGGKTPLVELLSKSEVSEEDEVTITVRVKDQGGGVSNVIFYVDEQPQVGRQASVVSDDTVSRTFALPPGARARRIEFAATNRAGVEGKREGLTLALANNVKSDAALHILAVGVEKYPDADMALKHSVSDANAIAEEIATRAQPLFKRGVFAPKVLKDKDADLKGIEQAFQELKKEMKPQDTLVIFLAGHGEAPVAKGYTFLPWDFKRGAVGDAGEGLSEARLRRILEQSPTNTLILADTCDAGGAADMIETAYQRMSGVSKHVVIGASRRFQFAKEGYQGHGVFTAALLRILRGKAPADEDPRLRVTDLRALVAKEVDKISRELGDSRQRVSGFLGSADFAIIMRPR